MGNIDVNSCEIIYYVEKRQIRQVDAIKPLRRPMEGGPLGRAKDVVRPA